MATATWRILAGLGAVISAAGCPALFPEVSTPISLPPATDSLDPPPPDDRHYVRVKGGTVPATTRDGRSWDSVFGSLPDPVAKVIVNEVELFKTSADSDTLEPKWEGSPSGNYPLALGDRIEIQLWDSNPLANTPIGVGKTTVTPDLVATGEVTVRISGGGTVTLAIEPARAVWGTGLWFELHNRSAYVSRLVDGSPATRAGIRARDRVLKIDGKDVDAMSLNELRSVLAVFPAAGRALTLQHAGGGTLDVQLKEGPIYPLKKEYGMLPVTPEP